MTANRFAFGILTGLLILSPIKVAAEDALIGLRQDQTIADFSVEAVYTNEADKNVGARFRHTPSGYVLDVLRIESIPQAFMWVSTPPPSEQGEPHTLEHLLLGKGTRGRYVASLEDMSLGRSSAFTQQTRTCYHFNTVAGTDVFFNLFEAKLEAMLKPTFSDEEIRREVAHMGITEDSKTGKVSLEEKGTVYNEMVSSFERPWGNLYHKLASLVFGEGHALSYSAGGLPSAIRTMGPDDIRDFHSSTHHLNNMGAVLSIGTEIPLETALQELSDIFKRLEPDAKPGEDPARADDRLPPTTPATVGTIAITDYPHESEAEPGLMVFAWPADRNLNNSERYMLELFFENLASDETSNLYQKFIDSQNRLTDIGASSVFSWVDRDPGTPVFLGFSDIGADEITGGMVDSIRGLVLAEIQTIAAYPDGSEELQAFNDRAGNRVIEQRRSLRKFLNTPPRFGYRGTSSRWLDHLQRLNDEGSFKRSLILKDELSFAEKELARSENIWREYIADWKLVTEKPYGVATGPSPEALAKSESDREGRIASYIVDLESTYSVSTAEEAIARYKETYDVNTAEIDKEAATIKMPGFIKEPPLGIDDQLNYSVRSLGEGGVIVSSTFENISSGTAGLAFNLNVVPENKLMYAAALPTLLSDIGVVRDGQSISYDRVSEMLRREILSYRSYFSVNYKTERAELVLRAAGSNSDEISRALGWLESFLLNPNLEYDNIARIRDAIDLQLSAHRNRTRRSEESWVNTPARAYWKQHNPLLLIADNFMTQEHAMLRLRWQLKEAESDTSAIGFAYALSSLSTYLTFTKIETREDIVSFLDGIINGDLDKLGDFAYVYDSLGDNTRDLMIEATKDIRQSLSGIPDNSLISDIGYLTDEIVQDLIIEPLTALASLRSVIGLLRRSDNVRGFAIANSDNITLIEKRLGSLIDRLDNKGSNRQVYSNRQRVTDRMLEHEGADTTPIFVGLVNNSTRAGVHINTSDCASFADADEDHLLKFLSARLYGGGGAHSMFMKTWGAGLAYSNGLRSNEVTGRLTYYAERCPDLAQTMKFVVNELKNAPFDTSLADYAVSQAFAVIRSGSTYESRGEAMAADLADGLTPEVVATFRRGVLDLRDNKKELYRELHERMASTYGEVLPGFGVSAKEAADKSNAIYFVIGPQKQLASYEGYIADVEDGAKLFRLYPRDFWLTE